MNTKKEEFKPVVLFVNQVEIDRQKGELQKYLDFVNSLSAQLADDDVELDSELLEAFSQEGTRAITQRLMRDMQAEGKMKLLYNTFQAEANRMAERYSTTHYKLLNLQSSTGHGTHSVEVVKGKAQPKSGIVEAIATLNTAYIDSPESKELHDRLSKFADDYNSLRSYIKESHPGCRDLTETVLSAITEPHFHMGHIASPDSYLVRIPFEPNEGNVMVNPMYFTKF